MKVTLENMQELYGDYFGKIIHDNLYNDPNINQHGNIVEIDYEDGIYEFNLGGSKRGAKYLQRLGSPGNYVYIYSNKRLNKLSRKVRFHYGRMIAKSAKWLGGLKNNYGATALNVKPKSWNTGIVNLVNKERGGMSMFVNFKTHQIYSYRSQRRGTGTSSMLAKKRKAGILRYR
jgi:hypothetical protein